MKAGFLSQPHQKQRKSTEPEKHVTSPTGSEATPLHDPEAAPTAIPQQQPATAEVQGSTNWQQCLELLKSDVDEKKFVGLLLVTKLLPHGDDSAVREVLNAVGMAFIQRLLLPLQQQQVQQAMDATKLQQQHLSVVLGLSILSAACRLPDIAGGDEVLQLVPLLLKVAAAGGAAPVLQPCSEPNALMSSARRQESWADPTAEAAAVVDALECVVACGSSGSYQQAVILESNGSQAAALALQSALALIDKQTINSQAATESAAAFNGGTGVATCLQQAMMSVHLISLMFGSQQSTAQQAAAEQPTVVAAAVMLLARVFGGSILNNGSMGNSSTSKDSADSAAASPDIAALQLQAQHALLLLLPLPVGSPAAAQLAHAAEAAALAASCQHLQQSDSGTSMTAAAAAAVAGDWPDALRRGLRQVLSSKVGAVQRHSALRLAAACLEIMGPGWLLAQQQQSIGSSDSRPEQFLLVLMEMLAIETPLLLSDAMNPTAAVPREDVAMAARITHAGQNMNGQQLQQQQQQQADLSNDAMEVQEQQQQDALSARDVFHTIHQQEEQAAQDSSSGPPGFQTQQKGKSITQQLAELALPADKPPGPGQQVAGQRAQQCLPSCYQLLEGCLDVLVEQVGLQEQLADMHGPEISDAAHRLNIPEPIVTAEGDARCVGLSTVLPALGVQQVQQLMNRLHQVTEVICEFLEHGVPSQAAATPGSDATTVDQLLIIGAVRILGRFLADAPDAHEASMQKLLPQLLALQTPGEGPLSCSGVCFLLPALLSWTSSSSPSHQKWASVLLDQSNGCLEILAAFANEAAATATGLASVVKPGQFARCNSEGSTEAGSILHEMQDVESKLGTVCQVLQQVLAYLPAARASSQSDASSSKAGQGQKLHKGCKQALGQLFQQLGSWAAARLEQWQAAAASRPDGIPAAISTAAAFLASALSVQIELSVILPAAALSGHLLLHLQGDNSNTAAKEAAAKLLCWGCEVGWSYLLLDTWLEQQSLQCLGLNTELEVLLMQLRDAWLSGELADVWDVCLSTATELLVEGISVNLQCNLAAAEWCREARQATAAVDATGLTAERRVYLDAIKAMVEASMSLQLLARACEDMRR